MREETKQALVSVLKRDPDFTPETVNQFIAGGVEFAGRVPVEICGGRILSRVQVANILRCSVATVDNYAKRGWLRRVFLPGSKRARGFSESSVRELQSEDGGFTPVALPVRGVS